jgi:cation:H+ antiporter
MIDFAAFPLWCNLGLFLTAGAAVWIAGTRLATYADVLSDRMGWGKAALGFVFLATATQLPEIVTNTTGALRGNGPLVLNGMFGGITMQTAVLAVADLFVLGTTLTFAAQKSINQLQGAILALMLALVLGATTLSDVLIFGHLGLSPVILAGLYIFATYLFWRYEGNDQWRPIEIPEEKKKEKALNAKVTGRHTTLRRLAFLIGLASVVILVCGILLVRTAESIAAQTGLGSSFIGVTLLASATSLPELSTTIAAVRLGSQSMAISNIFGSNLIMVFLLLPADLCYRNGAILNAADPSARFALISGIVVTTVYLTGLILRKPKRFLTIGIDSCVVLVLYVATLFVLYSLK